MLYEKKEEKKREIEFVRFKEVQVFAEKKMKERKIRQLLQAKIERLKSVSKYNDYIHSSV